jgi:hypothetical protein
MGENSSGRTLILNFLDGTAVGRNGAFFTCEDTTIHELDNHHKGNRSMHKAIIASVIECQQN